MFFLPGKISSKKRRAILNQKKLPAPINGTAQEAFFAVLLVNFALLLVNSHCLLVSHFNHAKKDQIRSFFCLFLYACNNWRRRASCIPLVHAGHIFHERPRGNSIFLLLFWFHPSSASLLAFNWRLHVSPVLR